MASSTDTLDSDKVPDLMFLMRMGARLEFAGGYCLQGIPRSRDIDVGTQFGSEGRWNMDADGLISALKDVVKMAHNDGYTLEGEPAGLGPRV